MRRRTEGPDRAERQARADHHASIDELQDAINDSREEGDARAQARRISRAGRDERRARAMHDRETERTP